MPRKANDPLDKSPLLGSQPKPVQQMTQPTQSVPHIHSTINPNKLDHARFTEMREMETENSSLRIIIYVIIVILIGVGGVFLIIRLVNGNQQNSNNTTAQEQVQNTTPVEQVPNDLVISTAGMPDSAATNVAKNEDYIDSTVITLGDSKVDITKASLSSIEYTKYTTFARVKFGITTDTDKLPKVNVAFNSLNHEITVDIVGIQTINDDLKHDITISDLVTTIKFDSTTNKYTLVLSDDSKYRVFADGSNLYIDIKTLKELAKPVEDVTATTTPTETTTTTPATDTAKPAAPHYENDFSQNTQYISSSVSGNTIALNNYYIWDQGTFFEFSWAQDKAVGDQYIPNTKAYLDTTTTAGTTYLMVEISNLSKALFSTTATKGMSASDIAAKTGTSLAGANFVRIDLVSFDASTGKAIYKIELKKTADYQLLNQKTYDGMTQITSVQIKD